MVVLKRILLIFFLLSCGDDDFDNCFDPRSEGKSCKLPDGSTSTGGTIEDTLNDPNDVVDATAIKFGSSFEINGIKNIYGASSIDGDIYFTGVDDNDLTVLGKYEIGDNISTTVVSLLSDNGITLNSTNEYFLISNLEVSSNIFLIESTSFDVIEVDKETLKALSKVPMQGNFSPRPASNMFQLDSRWNYIYSKNDWYVFGRVDGSLIEKKEVVDPSTGQVSENITTSGSDLIVSYDGENFYCYKWTRSELTVLNSDLSLKSNFSTSSFMYNNNSTRIVSNTLGAWIFGCQNSKCYRSNMTFVEQ